MLRRTRNDVLVHILDVQETDTAAIAYNTIGNIRNCQDVSFQLMLRKPLTGLLRTS